MPGRFDTTSYRYTNEHLILTATIFMVLVVIAVTATATVCLSVVFVLGAVLLAYSSGRGHHRQLLVTAEQVTPQSQPELHQIIAESAARLQVELVDVFVVPVKELNAYTFGLSSPKAIVLYQSLFRVMDRDEIQFILGHEMGHVKLGHTWLNSLVGGMAGIPAPGSAALLLVLALNWWNRACEYSADRAGMLACNNPYKAMSALVKLEVGAQGASPKAMAATLERIDAQDDDLLNNLGELFASHPLIVRRMEQLRRYARSSDYRRLQERMNQNIA